MNQTAARSVEESEQPGTGDSLSKLGVKRERSRMLRDPGLRK